MNSANGIFQESGRDYKQLVLIFQNSKISYIPEHISLTPPKESLGQTNFYMNFMFLLEVH